MCSINQIDASEQISNFDKSSPCHHTHNVLSSSKLQYSKNFKHVEAS